ncbi:MAG: DUF1232 domain-containing protein [Bacteroidota bacterium]
MAPRKLKENKFYRKAKTKAANIIGDREKMNSLVNASKGKLQTIKFEDSKVHRIAAHLRVIVRMIKAYADGSYRDLPWKSILAMVSSVIYFLMPLDLMPDFIPLTGLLDDFTVIMLVTGAFHQDIEAFLLWEEEKS